MPPLRSIRRALKLQQEQNMSSPGLGIQVETGPVLSTATEVREWSDGRKSLTYIYIYIIYVCVLINVES